MPPVTVVAAWSTYAANLAFVVGALAVLGASGWWAVAPFRQQFAYPLAQAPLAGLLLVPLGALAVNVLFRVEFWLGALATIVTLSAVSLIGARPGRDAPRLAWRLPLAVAGAAAASAAWFLMRTDLFFGSPGLVFAHGTDHLGYAQIADWLRLRPRQFILTPSPDDPYGSWAHYIYTVEPRFGSFAWLAMVSAFSGRSGAFAYDLASAILLAAAVPGVAALFTPRPLTFVVLAAGLFTSFWFDWNRAGYLGKTMGYPGTILVVGLLFASIADSRRLQAAAPPLASLAAMGALTAGAAIAFSGALTAFFLALLGGAFVLAAAVLAPAPPGSRGWGRGWRDPVLTLTMLTALAILSSGMIARPLFVPPNLPLAWSWRDLLLRATEVDGLLAERTGLPGSVVWSLICALLVAWIALAVLAIVYRVPAAVALLVAPLLMLGALVAKDIRWYAMNFIGLYVPLLLCGTVVLIDALAGPRARPWLARGLTLVLIAIIASHVPRFAATAAFHGGRDTPPLFRFSSVEMDALAAAIRAGGGSALVDTGATPHFAVFLMAEMGRRGIPLQWTAQSWKQVVGYRPWPVPTYPNPAPLRIVLQDGGNRPPGQLVLRTTQYDLLRQS